MNEYQYLGLAAGRWAETPLAEQILNIGSEVSRANCWRGNGNEELCQRTVDKAPELLSLTINAQKGMHDLVEFCRLYEIMADRYYRNNEYQRDAGILQRYFDASSYLV
ncbi:MAG: hypothetical protein IJV22_10080 [Bacteroidales bacterium]|nr:hypothetical protein [Bacteroidales bacterium]MBQ9639885.1 hypothetical protein [Bacteroidales bacterium]